MGVWVADQMCRMCASLKQKMSHPSQSMDPFKWFESHIILLILQATRPRNHPPTVKAKTTNKFLLNN